jgi:hypothetical protein
MFGSGTWDIGSALVLQLSVLVVVSALYVNNRFTRRSINVESNATLSIEAEPTVSWQIQDSNGEVISNGSGNAKLCVPISVIYKDCSLILGLLPNKWLSRLEQSRFCTYKHHLMYHYFVFTQNESDVLVCQLQLADHCDREVTVDGMAYLYVFIMNAVHTSRHWIWPDWFEIFARKVKQG